MKTDPGENNIRQRMSSPLRLSIPVRRRALPVAAAAALIAMATAISGCGEGSSATDVITQAAAELRSLAASPPQNPETRDREFGQIATKLGSVTAEGAAGVAAAGLLYEVQLAQGRARAELAGTRSGAINAAGRRTREDAIFFELAASRAAALRGVDPSPQRRDLQTEKANLGSTIEDLRAARVQTIGMLAMLQSERDQATERARNYRAQSRALRERARGIVGLQAAAIAEQAAATDRAADEAEGAAAEFEALAAALMPITSEIELQTRGADRRVEMADAAGVSLDRWAATARELSTEAQSLADTRERDLNQSVEALSQAIAAFEEISARAEQAFTQAGASATRSGRDAASRSSAKLSEATAKQALASTFADRAAAYASAAESLAYAAARTPAPSNAQTLRRRADELRTKAIESSTRANETLDEAASLYESVGGSDERLTRLASRLRAESSGGSMAGLLGSFDDTGVAGEIRAELMRVASEVTRGNFVALLEMIHAESDAARRTVGLVTPLLESATELESACREKFGSGLLDMFGELDMDQLSQTGMTDDSGIGGDPTASLMQAFADTDFEEQPDGSVVVRNAMLDIVDIPVRFVNMDGQWKLQLEIPPEFDQVLPMLQQMFTPLAQLLNVTARDVNSGHLASMEEVLQQIQASPVIAQLSGAAAMMGFGSGG